MTVASTIDRPGTAPSGAKLRALVVGGGLAGMACAVALEQAGVSVTLLEASNRLGGRAGSFVDPQTGEELDNCQHVLLGCCTNLLDFYRRIGVDYLIRQHRTIHFRDERGRYDLRGVDGAPAPLHLAPSLAMFSTLSVRHRVDLVRAMMAMLRLGRAGREQLDDVSFGQWLDEHRQPDELVEKLYEPILVSALNENARSISASAAIHVFQDALLTNSRGHLFGLPTCALGQLYRHLPCADVRLNTRVKELQFSSGAITGAITQAGEALSADVYVLATTYQSVQRLVPDEFAHRDERFAHLDKLQSVPILGAHLWFDRAVLRESHAALLGGALQWLFRKDAEGCAVHGVISAARQWVDVPKERCLEIFVDQIRRTLPEARGARLMRGLVVVEKRATFSPLPGMERLRPAQAPVEGAAHNLYLAGDYTRTGWPATMESAVRSGYLAGHAVIERSLNRRGGGLVEDLPLQWPARWLSR